MQIVEVLFSEKLNKICAENKNKYLSMRYENLFSLCIRLSILSPLADICFCFNHKLIFILINFAENKTCLFASQVNIPLFRNL